MRKLMIGLILVLFGLNEINAQINFRYDKGGNRKYRGISLTVTNGKIEKSDSLTSKANNDNYKVNVFPNPTSGMLYININNYPSDSVSAYHLIDLNGLTILNKKISNGENREDLSSYPNGVYQLIVWIGKVKENWKIIKE